MLTADPTILPGGHRVKTISFAEAAELAYFGAKVLHPATVVPAIEKNIPVLILNSRRPEVAGTRIVAEAVPCGNVVKSIACKRKITLVNIHSTRMLMAHGFLRRIFEVFDRYETPVDMVATCEVSVSLTIDNTARLDAIWPSCASSPKSAIEKRPGDRLPGGREHPLHAGRGAPRLRRAGRHQHPHDLAGRVAAEPQLRGGRDRPAARGRRRCTTSSSPSSTRRSSSERSGPCLNAVWPSSATARWAG